MPAYDVRPALAVDADRLGAVHVQVWREAYAGIMAADYLAGLDPVAGAARWRELLQDSTRSVLVGTADGEVVGFAFAGPSRDDPPVPEFELYAINVLAAHHGTGLAASLFDRAVAGGRWRREPVGGDRELAGVGVLHALRVRAGWAHQHTRRHRHHRGAPGAPGPLTDVRPPAALRPKIRPL